MLGIAIINYNQYEKTITCIQSIANTVHTDDYCIYLLDNGSQNHSAEILKTEYEGSPKVRLFCSKENLGYARGNNLLIAECDKDCCDQIIISNNDIIYHENAVDTLVKSLTEHSDYLLIGPKVLKINGDIQNSVKTERPEFKEYMWYSTYLHNLIPARKKAEHKKKNSPEQFASVYWIGGSCFIINAAKFHEIGCFDPYTFLYFEEYIISEKATAKGMKIGFEPAAVVTHYHGASTGGAANLFTRLENLKSELYFFSSYRHFSAARLQCIRWIRCLEVLYTFTKGKKRGDAFKYIKKSKEILRLSRKTKGKE